MDEVIGRLVGDVGVDRVAAETGVGIILDFLVKEGPADKMRLLLAKLPGAEPLMQKAARESWRGRNWRDRRRHTRSRAICLSTNVITATLLRD